MKVLDVKRIFRRSGSGSNISSSSNAMLFLDSGPGPQWPPTLFFCLGVGVVIRFAIC